MKNKIEIFEEILRFLRTLFMSFAIVILLLCFIFLGSLNETQNISIVFIWKIFAICFATAFCQFFLSFVNFKSLLCKIFIYFLTMLLIVFAFCHIFGFLNGNIKNIFTIFIISSFSFICVLYFVYYKDYKNENKN